MARKDEEIIRHLNRTANVEKVECGIRYTINGVMPPVGRAPLGGDPLDRTVDTIHKAAHRWFTRDKSTE